MNKSFVSFHVPEKNNWYLSSDISNWKIIGTKCFEMGFLENKKYEPIIVGRNMRFFFLGARPYTQYNEFWENLHLPMSDESENIPINFDRWNKWLLTKGLEPLCIYGYEFDAMCIWWSRLFSQFKGANPILLFDSDEAAWSEIDHWRKNENKGN